MPVWQVALVLNLTLAVGRLDSPYIIFLSEIYQLAFLMR